MQKPSVQTTLKGIAIAYILEATVLYVASGVILWSMITGTATAFVTNSALLVLTAGAALWLSFASRAITQGKRWARSAGVFWQLIQLAIAFGTLEASILGGLAIAIPSILLFFTLFTKKVVEATSS